MATGRILSGSASDPHAVPGLFGLQVFVVEDEALVLMMLEDMLAEFGCIVAGVAATVTQAMTQVRANTGIDAAILDVNLGGEKIFPVADALVKRHVPVVFSTGFGSAGLIQRYPCASLLHKPYAAEALAEVLLQVTRRPLH
jgi:CheY-like chemotaxis protein